ncbi:LysR family transcriptional regulator [Agrobacterium tumefaciens]|jgi:DNA-binding transcriptional LysR family regulator|uniref:Transcriptional regulator, LysR family n=2 Tax=Agrobacterium fabrum TaxID=1176649 RepID=A9CFQ8_AGRFC|nr:MULTISPECIES: LysR family transcriptional regulator [Agrobacterium tumefaciens complex]AAK89580.1 transcriptional regulator, LysR family [Agrobacterium fabrum str. C58]KEY54465.1 LysR family transcriptional regulator [Agrobacterium tumefaciens]KJX86377.1 Hydrogen peroxide-inducible genes activator [Agrobacterium tumefaciens]MCR6726183.1 LysR family transcriptional regulator [Agrobacterium fabrum]MCX2875919.1 LysR family transcriptional regulator [Agrobacterium fabrum]
MSAMRSLDPEAVEAFLLVAELQSFTQVAGVMNTSQAAISLRLRRLEDMLGHRLVERTPRRVRLTAAGERFLEPARAYVAAGRRALDVFGQEPTRLAIGVTHHLIGADLPRILRVVSERVTSVTLHLRTAGTRTLLELYDAGELDAIVVLRHDDIRRDGEPLFQESFGWYGSADFDLRSDVPVPLVLQPEPCNLRAMALRALESADIAWREVFVGTGATAVGAAVEAGIGVGLLAQSAAPASVRQVRSRSLPELPKLDVVMISTVTGDHANAVLRRITGAFRPS